MKAATRNPLAEILYRALAEPIGLLLATSDREKARARLYAVRKELGDEALAQLQIRVSPFEGGDLVICKSGPVASAAPVSPAPARLAKPPKPEVPEELA